MTENTKVSASKNAFAEQQVLYRDVLQFRIGLENFLIAGENGSLPLDLVRVYRSLLLTEVPADEQISVADAVALLRDVLMRTHAVRGQSWEDLALELNILFDKGNFKLFTINDLQDLMQFKSEARLSFCQPVKIELSSGVKPDFSKAGAAVSDAQQSAGTAGRADYAAGKGAGQEAKADGKNAAAQEQKVPAKIESGTDKPDAELQQAFNDLKRMYEEQSAALKALLAEREKQEKQQPEHPVYTAKSADGAYINWLQLVGKKVQIDDKEYLVSRGKHDRTVILQAENESAVDPAVFNDRMLNIKEVQTLLGE